MISTQKCVVCDNISVVNLKNTLYTYTTYVITLQDQFPTVDDAELKQMDEKIQRLTEKVKQAETSYRQLDSG